MSDTDDIKAAIMAAIDPLGGVVTRLEECAAYYAYAVHVRGVTVVGEIVNVLPDASNVAPQVLYDCAQAGVDPTPSIPGALAPTDPAPAPVPTTSEVSDA